MDSQVIMELHGLEGDCASIKWDENKPQTVKLFFKLNV